MRQLSVLLLIALLLCVSCQNNEAGSKDATIETPADADSTAASTEKAAEAGPASPETEKKAYAFPDIEGKHWVLTKYTYEGQQERPVGESTIFMQIKNNKLSGNGGCNDFDGQAFLAEDGTVNISNISKTKKLCGGLMIQETRFIELLEGSETFKVNLVFLELSGPAGQLTFRNDLK